MGKIQKFRNGALVETFEDFEVKDHKKAFVNPRLCVFGSVPPRGFDEEKTLTWPVAGNVKAYVRYEAGGELKEWLEKDLVKEGINLEQGICSAVATKRLAEELEVTPEEVLHQALKGMDEQGIFERMILEFCGTNVTGIPEEIKLKMPYVVHTNAKHEDGFWHHGAAVLANPKALENLHKRHGDFYVIPCSIHEIIICSVDMGMGVDELRVMVKEVNGTVIDNDEVLTDDVFIYDGVSLKVV